MEGCGPCNATRPEWNKIKSVTIPNSDNIYVVDIDQTLSSKLNGLTEPNSFPTMRFVTNGGKIVENYEDSSIEQKDRTIDSFVKWIKSKSKNMVGGKRTRRYKKRKTLKKNSTIL